MGFGFRQMVDGGVKFFVNHAQFSDVSTRQNILYPLVQFMPIEVVVGSLQSNLAKTRM